MQFIGIFLTYLCIAVGADSTPSIFGDVYKSMDEWLSYKPTINLPHFCDLLNPVDSNFDVAAAQGASIVGNDGGQSKDPALHAFSTAAYQEPTILLKNSKSPSWNTSSLSNVGIQNKHLFESIRAFNMVATTTQPYHLGLCRLPPIYALDGSKCLGTIISTSRRSPQKT